jgi:Pro-kumamolisin, activation domain/ell wall binding domain 2 (CWB2)
MREQGVDQTPLRGATRKRIARVGVPVTALAVIAATGIQAADAAAPAAASGVVSVGSAPRVPGNAVRAAAPSGSAKVTVDVALKPRNEAELQSLATAVSTPGSADYRHYLTKSQVAANFAPSQTTIDAVDAALRSVGLTPGAAIENGALIPVSATFKQLTAAFGTGFAGYRLADGRSAFVNTAAPKIPAAVAGDLSGVVGLDDLVAPTAQHVTAYKPQAVKGGSAIKKAVVSGKTSEASATCASYQDSLNDDYGLTPADDGVDYYSPQSLVSAYGLGSAYSAGDFGNGVDVAVVEWENDSPAAISDFENCYNLDVPVSYVPVEGGPTAPADDEQNIGVESSLDIEDIAALAPGVSITDYEGPDITDTFTDADWLNTLAAPVNADTAKVISVSWGGCELDTGDDETLYSGENDLLMTAALQGQSFFTSSGDQGSTDCWGNDNGHDADPSVDDPAAQPFATGVGGTSMDGKTNPSISVWNNSDLGFSDPGAGGGGVSVYQQVDTADGFYQYGFTGKGYNNACDATAAGTSCRQVPDVSALADPYTGYLISAYDAGEGTIDVFPIGGTSGAAPTWAAITALADSSSACSSNPAGFVNPGLYDLARKASLYSSDFSDVTKGNNDIPDSGYTGTDYSATTGYDLATGVGSPKAAALVKSLCAAAAPSPVRLWGSIAINTAISISGHDFADNGTATVNGEDSQGRIQAGAVVLSRSDEFYDALAGSALAAQQKAPLLITPPSALNAGVQAEIQRVLPQGGTVYLLGGTAALSQAVQDQITSLGYTVTRFAGSNMFDTARLIDQAISPNPTKVIVATGEQYYDALSAGAAAGANPGTVVVLTDGKTMPAISAQYLNTLKPTAAYGAGGPGATALANAIKSKQVTWGTSVPVTSLVGATAPDTSLLLAGKFFTNPPEVAIATSSSWYDALTGGAAAGLNDSPLLLTAPSALYSGDATYISAQATHGTLKSALILGGPAALSATIMSQVQGAME